ncbi:MAG: trypsin-like serine peptidase, partial [Bdellovibrionota bacterium]
MKTPSTWILLPLTGFLLLGASACGKGDPGRQIRTKDQQGAYDMMDQATVRCDDPAKCHSGIAMLVGVEQFDEDGDTKWGVGECTGFLIAPDILATNSHCIADTLKDKGDGADCSGEAQIFFPAFGNYAEKRVDCAKILKASQIGSTHEAPDYAFVKLSEPVTDREIIALDNSGFEDRQKIRIIKVDPTSKHKPVGSMTSNECIALRKTIILQSSDSALSPTLALGDCDVIHGNSGSPIFDEAGHARGIL